MTLQEALTSTVEAELAASNKTKTELAKTLQISPRSLQNRLRAKTSWTTDEIEKISNFLDMTPWMLINLSHDRATRK